LKSKITLLTTNKQTSIWRKAKLGDYVSHQKGYPFKSSEYQEFGRPIIRVSDFTDETVILKNCNYLKEEDVPKYAAFLLRNDDVVISTVGSGLRHRESMVENVVRIHLEASNTLLNQNAVILRGKSGLDQIFLYFRLKSDDFRNHLLSNHQGSANQASITLETIFNFEFLLPKYSDQIKIRDVLENLDRHKRNLEKQNQILEKIIQTIFKSWFVDFDGQTEFVDSELGQIPKNWRIEHLDNIAVFLNGLPLQRFRPTNNSFLPVIKIREMKNGISVNTEKARTDIEKKYIVNDGNILFSWSGTLELVIWTYGLGALNQHIFKVTSENYEKWFYYFWIKFYLPEFRSIADSKVTTMGHIQKHHLSEALILIPDQETLEEMNKIMIPLFNKFIKTKMFSQNLTKIRDSLLPKLMSGELRV